MRSMNHVLGFLPDTRVNSFVKAATCFFNSATSASMLYLSFYKSEKGFPVVRIGKLNQNEDAIQDYETLSPINLNNSERGGAYITAMALCLLS